ncbi:MAG TPA: hypothetical protein VK969_04260 [Acidimicrobiia bacterium]|nr:hypothetical protein [Acidimicrobiia bacterium]
MVRRAASGAASDYGAGLILVRPDHFVSWVGDRGDYSRAREVMARSAGR